MKRFDHVEVLNNSDSWFYPVKKNSLIDYKNKSRKTNRS